MPSDTGASFFRKVEIGMIHFLNRIQHKYKGIPNLMKGIVIGSVIVYLLGYFGVRTVQLLGLFPEQVMNGEIWRVVSFVFLMPVGNLLFAAFVFYFYYLVGSALEQEWGSLVFTAYYGCNILLTVLISLLGGIPVTSAASINLSLFLAFGYLFPDYTILLFMFIPIKMKYLAWFYGVYTLYQAIVIPGIFGKLLVLTGLITFVLFFYSELYQKIQNHSSIQKNRRKFQTAKSASNNHLRIIRHQCEICKRTELDDPNLEFRYCSGCDGYHEYCLEHLGTHVHIKDLDKN